MSGDAGGETVAAQRFVPTTLALVVVVALFVTAIVYLGLGH